MTRIARTATFLLSRPAARVLDIMKRDYAARKNGLPPASKEFFILIDAFGADGEKVGLKAGFFTYRQFEKIAKGLRVDNVLLPSDFFNPVIFTVTVCPIANEDRTLFGDVSVESFMFRAPKS